MSFLNITDPKKRDSVVTDYLKLVKELQQQNLNEKAGELTRVDNLKKLFEPVVQSTEKSTTEITKELAPLREEMRNLNENLVAEQQQQHIAGIKRKPTPPPRNVFERYLQIRDKRILDKYFGIQYTRDGNLMMGDGKVTVDKSSNIHVNGITYKGTPGLWALVMEATPKEDEYTVEDFTKYENLVFQTNVILHPRNLTAHSRHKATYKWKNILLPMQQWGQQDRQQQLHLSHDHIQQQSHGSSSPLETFIPGDDDDDEEEKTTRSSGDGIIQYLPKDINGLTTKLQLLLGEFAAGNRTSTRNEIVFILDELLRRKKLSRKEYRDINSYLSRCL